MNLTLTHPGEVAPDLTTAGALRRYGRLRKAGFDVRQSVDLADAGFDVLGHVVLGDPS